VSAPSDSDATDVLRGRPISVVEGRDGWLFLGGYGNTDVLRLYTDEHSIGDDVLARWARTLARRQAYLASRGITYLTFVVPDAYAVYPDKLPAGVDLAASTPFERLSPILDEAVMAGCVFPLQQLIDGRSSEETFQSVDTHWTDWGGWLGYNAAMSALQLVLPTIRIVRPDELTWSVRSIFGALGSIVTPERSASAPVAKITRPAARVTLHITTEMRDGYVVFEQDAPELPSAVIFRDSFMTAPGKFFCESFRRTVFVSSPNTVFYDLVERERPEVVIHQLAERRLWYPPVEPSPFDFRAIFGDLLLDDPQAVAAQRRSRSLASNGRADEALVANDEALTRTRPTARLLMHRAKLHAALGRTDAAVEALRHATTLSLSDGGAWHALSHLYSEQERAAEAFSAAVRAVELEPAQAAYWTTAVVAAVRSGEVAQAADLARRGRELCPDSEQPYYAESVALLALNRLEEAEAAIRSALELAPSAVLYSRQLASILMRREDWAAAEECLARIPGVERDAEQGRLLAIVRERLAAA
jgi:alginate O-acetyltransferase complex protein AlgJ